jgi:catechol 2,3-dioxygenase-like lactoylglutathione lyase family enzyme
MIGTAHHYGVTVSDMEEVLPFYRDTLGLEVLSRGHVEAGTEDSEKFEDFVGVDGAVDVEVVFLDAGGCQVELLQYNSPEGTDAHGASNNDAGASHFCLEVEDIDELYEELTDDGIEFVYEPITLSKGVRVAYMYDPEGNIVELSDRSRMD